MKKLFFLPVLLLVYCGSAFAQDDAVNSIVGTWSGEFKDAEGKSMPFTMKITDKTYEFDFDGDGKADLVGGYTSSGSDQITIWNTTDDESAGCPSDQKGVYQYFFVGTSLSFNKVSDDCPGRGDEPLVLKRL
ncbi:MAG: hypothetical protein H6574_16060 [Lewinellaceae bacterium]|nr:hypothetical protein [Lewinellaceae bacterium]MCB9332597.1 hypothetical protein [Lewinellaceae bacterium]